MGWPMGINSLSNLYAYKVLIRHHAGVDGAMQGPGWSMWANCWGHKKQEPYIYLSLEAKTCSNTRTVAHTLKNRGTKPSSPFMNAKAEKKKRIITLKIGT